MLILTAFVLFAVKANTVVVSSNWPDLLLIVRSASFIMVKAKPFKQTHAPPGLRQFSDTIIVFPGITIM